MKDETRDRRRDLLWALPASLILHALIVALLVYGLPSPRQQPQQEQAINVALVPPPEQPKPKPVLAPPPKGAKAEKPPEPKVEKPPEQKIEKPPPPVKQPPKPSQIEVLKPVFQFGDKDAGPRKSLDGGSAQDSAPAPAKEDDSKPPVTAKDAESKSAASPGSEEPAVKDAEKQATPAKDAERTQDVEKQAAATKDANKQDADKQKAATQDADKQEAAVATVLATPGDEGEIVLPAAAQVPQPKPANTPKPKDAPKPVAARFSKLGSGSVARPRPTEAPVAASRGYSGLPGVRKLNSRGATGDALATTSMAGVPRDQRAAKLCASTLQQQLLDASYYPDLVPLVPLKAGNILDVPETAFHTRTTWYNLSFRCELDSDVTRVLSFTFSAGTPIPPDQWARLGLPIRY